MSTNRQLILIMGESATGKSASLMNIPDQENWVYLNFEGGKEIPFPNDFPTNEEGSNAGYIISDTDQVNEALEHVKEDPSITGVIFDTITFMMDMYESQNIYESEDSRQGWQDYAQFFKQLMQKKIAELGKPVIMLAHSVREKDGLTKSKSLVPIKGSLKDRGLEAFFTTVVAAKKVNISELDKYQNDMLHITEMDKILGYKHVFQTMLTADTVGDRIRSPIGMFDVSQTYIDNDTNILLEHIRNYYKKGKKK